MTTTLYDLALQGSQIEDMLSESIGEITPDIQDKMDDLLIQGPAKLESAATVVRKLEWYAQMAEEESARLHQRAKQFDAMAAKIKERMTLALDKAFGGKVKTPKWTFWTQKSADRTIAELVPGTTPEMLYKERPDLVRVKMDLDRAKAVELYKNPETRKDLPELLLFEEKEGDRSVRIK